MRISTDFKYEMYTSNIDAAQQRLFQAQQQEATGIRISNPSDDPVGIQQVLNMQNMQDQLTQYQSNLSNAKSNLNSTDGALSSLNSVMNQANQLAIQASSGTQDSTSLQAITQQIQAMQQQVLAIGNQKSPNGQYLFAGQKADQQPFSASNGTLTYAGDNNSIQVAGGPSNTITINVPGDPVITDAYKALQSLKNDLQSGNASTISNIDIKAIQASQTTINLARGTVGARGQTVSTLTDDNTRRISDLTTQISGLKNVNIAQAATSYAQAQNAYQAALSVVGQGSNLSLLSYIQGNVG